jgi:hypothetical protein
MAPTAMTPSTMIPMVPAPASTAGMVKTPVPTMLPMTKPVAEVSPRAWAFSLFRGESGWSGGTGPEVGVDGGPPFLSGAPPTDGGEVTAGADESIIGMSFLLGNHWSGSSAGPAGPV